MEVLAAELADLMRTDPGDPFAPERIVVSHPTIGRWLALELASELGIVANVRFELPGEFAWSILRAAVPGLPKDQPYRPEQLRWRIHDALPGRIEGSEAGTAGSDRAYASSDLAGLDGGAFPNDVRRYLADGDPRKRFELADRLARACDRCLLYRPDWIRAWERGAAPHWQAGLWQRLVGMDGRTGTPPGTAPSAPPDTPPGTLHWVAAIDAFRIALDGGAIPLRSSVSQSQSGATPAAVTPAGSPSTPFDIAAAGHSPGSPDIPAPAVPSPDWPRRAVVFAVPALSPSYLELLYALDRSLDLHLFLLNPCREYWGDVHPRREIDRRTAGAAPATGYFAEGNELLAAWGRAGRDTVDALIEVAGADWVDCFVPPAGTSRLAAVQRDILDLRLAREAAEAEAPPAPDDSIQIHVCHSPVREAEVLHDRLLALFDAHPDLEPADVLVLTPDLSVYGPAVEAVFAAAGRIPCNAARARSDESRAVQAFLDLLALPGSRYGAESVLAPLAAPAVRTRFGIDEADLPAIRALVGEAGIRWGIDDVHRTDQDLPATADHTWRQGLRRLLLGYAMEAADTLVAGLVPCPATRAMDLAGGDVDGALLGRFVSYCEGAFGLRTRLVGARRPAQWGETLRAVVEEFFSDGSDGRRGTGGTARRPAAGALAADVGAVRELIRGFVREAGSAQSPVRFEVVLDVLRERVRDTSREPARLSDGVTLASLRSGEVFPAGIVCTIGMNDGAFPRFVPTPSFDPMAAGPARRGDRDVRLEDRLAFLEALLAARHCFLATCTGRGLRDDAPIPPSVLVDELKDYLDRRFPGTQVEIRHPLQPFSPRYFSSPVPPLAPRTAGASGTVVAGSVDAVSSTMALETVPGRAQGSEPVETSIEPGNRSTREVADEAVRTPDGEVLFSYARGMRDAAEAMLNGSGFPDAPGAAPERFAVALPEPNASRRCIAFADLVAMFANPARFFLRERLGIRLEAGDAALDEEEPFEIDGLERYRLRGEAWDQLWTAGATPQWSAGILAGRGRLPSASLGHICHERVWEEAEQLASRLAPYRAVLDAPPREIDFELGGFRVVGALDRTGSADREPQEAGPDRMVWWRQGRLRARDRIEIELRQLVRAAAGHGPAETVGIWLEKGTWKTKTFPPPEQARERLEPWLHAWWRGLATPLPFCPETSLAWAEAFVKTRDKRGDARKAAGEKAREAWYGSAFRRGERHDPWLGLVHDAGDGLLTGEFEDLASALLVPLFEAYR